MNSNTLNCLEHDAQYINWGELVGKYQCLLWNGLGISQQVAASDSIVHHLSVLGFISFLLSPFAL